MLRRGSPRLLALALGLALVGCGADDDASVSRARFEDRMQERLDADPEQAACITDYVFADYDTGAVRTIYDEGITGVPQGLWDPYFYSVIGCLNPDAGGGP